ncbi:uncharacterized protein SOCE26_048950 [Sorangium cellulosum]|uniref:Uncharacterized protein n=1 Tax=Sorangium cellulosum TaxID=56 RepID=A0A2L0EVW9_SORCE|nr:hypothetical protein [Sorangium cellulosum]AUX43447.1 uncharacterized protein SOCE26_048950 [Sorangium cellulosum]
MHPIPRTLGIFASGGALIAAALSAPPEPGGYSWVHLGLPLALFVYARCWLDEGRARERRARGLGDED